MVRGTSGRQAACMHRSYRHAVHTLHACRLNEKHLRDLAGPLSASDMHSLFTPVSFNDEWDSSQATLHVYSPASARTGVATDHANATLTFNM